MHMIALKTTRTRPGKRHSRGVSLIIVLILMIIIGITASTAMRTATSEQRATNNLRMEASALQYAEAALRYCENEMKKSPPSSRNDASLQGTIPGPLAPGPLTSGWEDPLTWTNTTGRASSTRTAVPDTEIQDNATNTALPNKKPECVVEQGTGVGIVITARGFSPDYVADASGNTTSGAVVWVQSFNN
ncbi:MAG: PilX N-terminal domain-containing pilus assembly protein [Pseudomonadota bacterium]